MQCPVKPISPVITSCSIYPAFPAFPAFSVFLISLFLSVAFIPAFRSPSHASATDEIIAGHRVTEQCAAEQRTSEQSAAEYKASEQNTTEPDIPEQGFFISEIPEDIRAKIIGYSYKDYAPVSMDDLRYLHLLHKDLEGNTREGEMICHMYIADDLLEIFQELYDADYPIEKIRLVEEYEADDETSMEDNNTSCFNVRMISGSGSYSWHAYGLAVDINTLYNPYILQTDSGPVLEPVTAWDYTDRCQSFPYKIEEDDLCCRLFKEHGFTWGGDWYNPKDYQHFEMPMY